MYSFTHNLICIQINPYTVYISESPESTMRRGKYHSLDTFVRTEVFLNILELQWAEITIGPEAQLLLCTWRSHTPAELEDARLPWRATPTTRHHGGGHKSQEESRTRSRAHRDRMSGLPDVRYVSNICMVRLQLDLVVIW
jgi:hypothetical protein